MVVRSMMSCSAGHTPVKAGGMPIHGQGCVRRSSPGLSCLTTQAYHTFRGVSSKTRWGKLSQRPLAKALEVHTGPHRTKPDLTLPYPTGPYNGKLSQRPLAKALEVHTKPDRTLPYRTSPHHTRPHNGKLSQRPRKRALEVHTAPHLTTPDLTLPHRTSPHLTSPDLTIVPLRTDHIVADNLQCHTVDPLPQATVQLQKRYNIHRQNLLLPLFPNLEILAGNALPFLCQSEPVAHLENFHCQTIHQGREAQRKPGQKFLAHMFQT